MNRKVIVLCLVVIGCLGNIYAQDAEIKKWYVADAKIACQLGDAVTSCLRIRENPDSNWVSFPFEIEGFVHEKGFEYEIEVSQVKLKYTEINGPQYKWTLNRIISEKSTVHIDKRLLMNNTFQLINIDIFGKKTLAMRAKPFMKFEPDSNRIYGFMGCNNFSAPCNYANAYMEFGLLDKTLKTCAFTDIETKFVEALKGKATFYVRSNMLYIVCENFTTLHLRPERRLDSILNVIEMEKLPKNDINFMKNEDGSYRISAPNTNGNANLFFMYKPNVLTTEEKKKIKFKFTPLENNPEVSMIQVLNKEHENARMYYAVITYKNGAKREVEIRDDSN